MTASASASASGCQDQNQYLQNQYLQDQILESQDQILQRLISESQDQNHVLTEKQIVEIATIMAKSPNANQKVKMLAAVGAYEQSYDPHQPMAFTYLSQDEAVYTVAGCLRYYGNYSLEKISFYYQVTTAGRLPAECQ